MSDNT